MLTIEIKINGTPADRIDVINVGRLRGKQFLYDIVYYDYVEQAMDSFKCSHSRANGRINLMEQVAKAIQSKGLEDEDSGQST